jgi:uncharacterized protein (DUF952 family)
MSPSIYKILTQGQWASLQAQEYFGGSADDKRDGFIHLSSAGQLQGTLDKHYPTEKTGRADIILAAVDAAALGSALKYETSRGGQAFPHLYARLPLSAVSDHWVLKCNSAKGYQVPDCLSLDALDHHQQDNS